MHTSFFRGVHNTQTIECHIMAMDSKVVTKRTTVMRMVDIAVRNVRTLLYNNVVIPYLETYVERIDPVIANAVYHSTQKSWYSLKFHVLFCDRLDGEYLYLDNAIGAITPAGELCALPLSVGDKPHYTDMHTAQTNLVTTVTSLLIRASATVQYEFPHTIDASGVLSQSFLFSANHNPCFYLTAQQVGDLLGKDKQVIFTRYIMSLQYLSAVQQLMFHTSLTRFYSTAQWFNLILRASTEGYIWEHLTENDKSLLQTLSGGNIFDLVAIDQADRFTARQDSLLTISFSKQAYYAAITQLIYHTNAEAIAMATVGLMELKRIVLQESYTAQMLGTHFIPKSVVAQLLSTSVCELIRTAIGHNNDAIGGAVEFCARASGLFVDGAGSRFRHGLNVVVSDIRRHNVLALCNYNGIVRDGRISDARDAAAIFMEGNKRLSDSLVDYFELFSSGNTNKQIYTEVINMARNSYPQLQVKHGRVVASSLESVFDAPVEALLSVGFVSSVHYNTVDRMAETFQLHRFYIQ